MIAASAPFAKFSEAVVASVDGSGGVPSVAELAHHAMKPEIPLYMVAPFVLLLLAISLIPLINRHWWEKRYPWVSLVLGCITVGYYILGLGYENWETFQHGRVWHTAVEYFSFICLIGSLFVVSSGVLIKIKSEGSPSANVVILFVGSLIANVIGTTGASILLIRPFIRINRYRIKGYHIIFFIFTVSNVGGALTPIGDPPLFLGYLKGIPFFWVLQNVWMIWLATIGMILAIFYVIDSRHYARLKQLPKDIPEQLDIRGLKSVVFLAMILFGVFLQTPIREIVMIAAGALAYFFGDKQAMKQNDFNWFPIKEVAILFAGIFATMMAALDWLEANAAALHVSTPGHFYFATGVLSSFLDNAPTYLNFLSTAMGLLAPGMAEREAVHLLLDNHPQFIRAISMGAVFFGACTYIGNAPNFMVKSISEQSGVKMAGFLGYMVKYSIPILVPVLVLDWLVFFR